MHEYYKLRRICAVTMEIAESVSCAGVTTIYYRSWTTVLTF